VVFAPIAGLLMGVVQTWFETRPDNWAFAVHRPVSRTQVFIAKCTAGLILLYVAQWLPCVVAVAWASRPGNLAMSFQSRMALPLLADVLNSGVYYFVGMAITLRRARWLGTRLLPLGLALLSSGMTFMFFGPFWQA